MPLTRFNHTPKTQELKGKLLSLIRQRPGLSLDRLCVAAGIKFLQRCHTPQISRLAKGLIAELEAEGLIYSQRDRFAGVGDRPKLFPAGFEPIQRSLFQPAFVSKLTVSHVPLSQIRQAIEAPALNPVRPLTEPKPIMNEALPPIADTPIVRAGKNESDRRSKIAAGVTVARAEKKRQIAEAILNEVERLILLGSPFSIVDVERGAGVSQQYLNKCQPELWQQVKDAIAAFNDKQQATEAQLKQQIEDLEARNKELRSQLANVQPQVVELPPIAWLRRERSHWLDRIGDLADQIQQLEEDLHSVRENLEACDRVLATHEMELVGAEVSSNGHQEARAC